MKTIKSICSALFILISTGMQAQTTLISQNDTWKYLDDGSNLGTSWTDSNYNDASWSSGSGVFGYGTLTGATVSTTVSYGPSSTNKYVTTYFRKSFSLSNPTYNTVTLNLLLDDGAIIYINGTQVLSDNMPGSVTYTTYANSAIGGSDEGDYVSYTLSGSYFVNGTNVIAVEVHQATAGSSDLGFDLEVSAATNTSYVASGDSWYYWDQGSTPSGSWKTDTSYANTSWGSGTSELGYGDGDESTTVGYGGNASNKYVTTYFRKVFTIDDTSSFDYLSIDYVRDDGIVVYINGEELIRDNMPSGTIGNTTTANSALGGTDESDWNNQIVLPATLYQGSNVVAVEIHQADVTSSDISFNLEIEGIEAPVPSITRGPYLQLSTDTSMLIRYVTDVPCESHVRYGTSYGTYNNVESSTSLTTDHQVHIGGLDASTKYYYHLSSNGTDTILALNPSYYFITNPTPGSRTQPVRFWVLGDQGQPGAPQDSVHSKFFQQSDWIDSMDAILMLGDNAYNSGLENEFQAAVFDPLDTVLRNTPLYSTVGNHEVRYVTAHSISTPSTTPYYYLHNFPTAGEAGGQASGTESYFSLDYGNVHLISINAEEEDLDSATSSMWSWLETDLQQNTNDWIFVIVHQGPYTKGSHNSDTETEHIKVRENFLPLLERYGVDLMMSGHSHSYERSKLVKGHFGLSGTYSSATHDIDGGFGRMPGFGSLTNDCPYQKVTTGSTAGDGAVYITAGSSSKVGGGSVNHPVMKVNYLTYGSCYVEFEENRMDLYYLEEDGDIADYFTLFKDIEYDSTTQLQNATQTLTASWPGGPYYWSNGATTRSITVTVSNDTLFTVANASSGACIVDSFDLDFPQVVRYPWSETDTLGMTYQDADGAYVIKGDAHTAADANGWYYYFNQNDTNNLLFAVRNSLSSGNSLHIDTVIDYIELRYTPSIYSRLVTGTDSFRMVLNYDWNVVTKNQPNGGMDIKFYFDSTILASFSAVADSIAATNTDLNAARTWFKSSQAAGVSFVNSDISIDSVAYATDLNSLLVAAPNYTSGVGSTDGSAFSDYGNAKNYIQWNDLTSFSGGTLTQTLFDPTPVPVEWLSFKAHWSGLHAEINWATAMEVNNDYFIIERSFDGVNFSQLGIVPGSGNSTGITSYSYTDKNAMLNAGQYVYYRIKQVDYNGDFSYSEIERLELDPYTSILVYPIPATTVVNVELSKELSMNADLKVFIFNSYGEQLKLITKLASREFSIDVESLSSGWYIMAVQIDGKVHLKRFVVQ